MNHETFPISLRSPKTPFNDQIYFGFLLFLVVIGFTALWMLQ